MTYVFLNEIPNISLQTYIYLLLLGRSMDSSGIFAFSSFTVNVSPLYPRLSLDNFGFLGHETTLSWNVWF